MTTHQELCDELIRLQKKTLRAYAALKKARQAEIAAAMALKQNTLNKSQAPGR
jgi:hypothetical protein